MSSNLKSHKDAGDRSAMNPTLKPELFFLLQLGRVMDDQTWPKYPNFSSFIS